MYVIGAASVADNKAAAFLRLHAVLLPLMRAQL